MNNKIIIAIDAMGGENAPFKNIDLFKIYLIKFHNYCYELNEKSIIEGKIKFDL